MFGGEASAIDESLSQNKTYNYLLDIDTCFLSVIVLLHPQRTES